MAIINLKKEHTLYDASNKPACGIGFEGHGVAFLKKDLTEGIQYCEALDREEVQNLFNQADAYHFGTCSLEWTFTPSPPLGKGKQAMWFAKYFKNGYFEEPYE